jgi:hypothetical protein
MEEFVMPTEAMLLNSNVEDIEDRLPTVVFCLKGDSFTQGFFLSWTKLILFLNENKLFNVRVMNYSSSNSFDTRNILLGGKKGKGKIQSVFEDEIVYDFIFLMDTNINFEPMHVVSILAKLTKVEEIEVISGIYPNSNGKPNVYEFDSLEYLVENGSYKFAELSSLIETGDYSSLNIVSVPSVGLGFMGIQRGVFEKLTYPWFEPYVLENDDVFDLDDDEVSFCKKLRDLNISVYVDSKVILSKDNVQSLFVS